MKKNSIASVVVASTISLMTMTSATAEESQNLKTALEQCAAISNPLERLVCFDKVVAGEGIKIADKTASRNVNKPTERSVKNRDNGFGAEHIKANRNDQSGDDDTLFINIVKHSTNPYGYLRIETADGQIWQQTTSERFPFDADAEYYIERGVLGAYYLGRTDLNSRTRVKRIK